MNYYKKNREKTIWIILVITIVLLVGGFLISMLFFEIDFLTFFAIFFVLLIVWFVMLRYVCLVVEKIDGYFNK